MSEKIGRNPAAGVVVGQSASALVAFHGATATDQYTLTSVLASVIPVKASGTSFGFSTSTKFKAAMALLSSLRALVVEKGLGA